MEILRELMAQQEVAAFTLSGEQLADLRSFVEQELEPHLSAVAAHSLAYFGDLSDVAILVQRMATLQDDAASSNAAWALGSSKPSVVLEAIATYLSGETSQDELERCLAQWTTLSAPRSSLSPQAIEVVERVADSTIANAKLPTSLRLRALASLSTTSPETCWKRSAAILRVAEEADPLHRIAARFVVDGSRDFGWDGLIESPDLSESAQLGLAGAILATDVAIEASTRNWAVDYLENLRTHATDPILRRRIQRALDGRDD
ncbi:MAG: hypothetical protein KDB61_07175, partial [Planctomycetes bacterium]|nr:hypothetical protein [Planctomycetota bacterium]